MGSKVSAIQRGGLDDPPYLSMMKGVATVKSTDRAQRLELNEAVVPIHLG
jgi:hypothetical protein